MLVTDWAAPGAIVLGRLKDVRARQYWDPQHLLALRLAADARDPQPKQACCLRNDVLWDLAALYPAGAQWKDALPPAIFFNGPIVKRQAGLETALRLGL
jgi:hypothetical protein